MAYHVNEGGFNTTFGELQCGEFFYGQADILFMKISLCENPCGMVNAVNMDSGGYRGRVAYFNDNDRVEWSVGL